MRLPHIPRADELDIAVWGNAHTIPPSLSPAAAPPHRKRSPRTPKTGFSVITTGPRTGGEESEKSNQPGEQGIARGTIRSAEPGSVTKSLRVPTCCSLADENSRGKVQNVCGDSFGSGLGKRLAF
jgi:hypothetical protein